MDNQRKRALAEAYRERKRSPGVFAVRCTATGQVWTGATPNLDAQKNSIWFGLRTGGHRNAALAAAWRAHGPDALEYEVLERLDAEKLSQIGLQDALKERARHWKQTLSAEALFV